MTGSTKITPAAFTRLIKQAKLTLSASEQIKIHEQLDDTLSAVKVLKELDTQHVGNATSASGLVNVWREDVVTPSFPQDLALSNAKATHADYFLVPPIFESQDN